MQTKVTEKTFEGQSIYVGIDVHRKDFKVSVMAENVFYKTFSAPPQAEVIMVERDLSTLSQHMRELFPGEEINVASNGKSVVISGSVGVAITGEAGPNAMERPAGTIVVAVSTPDDTRARELSMVGDRERIRIYGVTTALHLTRLALEGKWWQS